MKKIFIFIIFTTLLIVGLSFSSFAVEYNNITDYMAESEVLQDGSVRFYYRNLPVPTVRNSFRRVTSSSSGFSGTALSSTGSISQTGNYIAQGNNWLVFNIYDGTSASRWNFNGIGVGQEVTIRFLYTYTCSTGNSSASYSTSPAHLVFSYTSNFTYSDLFTSTYTVPYYNISLSSAVTPTASQTMTWNYAFSNTGVLEFTFTMPDMSLFQGNNVFPVIAFAFPGYVSSFSINSISLQAESVTSTSVGQMVILNNIYSMLSDPYNREFIGPTIIQDNVDFLDEVLVPAQVDFSAQASAFGGTFSLLNSSLGALSFWSSFFKVAAGGTVGSDSGTYTYSGHPLIVFVLLFSAMVTFVCFLLGFRWQSTLGFERLKDKTDRNRSRDIEK